jgi:integrase
MKGKQRTKGTGSVRERERGGRLSYLLVYDTGYTIDAATGTRKRQQKQETFWPERGVLKREARQQAEAKLRERLAEIDKGTFAEPSKMTVLTYLRDWLDKCIKPPMRAAETYRVYKGFIDTHIASSALATVPLQKLRGTHIERYYADRLAAGLSSPSVIVHHAMLSGALKKATKERLLARNPMADVDAKPKLTPDHDGAKRHCWDADEASAFLTEAQQEDAQTAAFFALALDSGARKGELFGLRWEDVDLDAAQVRIDRQMYCHLPAAEADFGPTKTKRGRTVAIGAQTVALLRTHRRTQSELKMRNRDTYHDLDLVFAREYRVPGKVGGELGDPMSASVLAEDAFRRVAKRANVRKIKFHGLRHTSATLLLRANVPPHVVARRLGHSQVTTTLETYAHVLPDMSADAAAKLAAVLHAPSNADVANGTTSRNTTRTGAPTRTA